MIIRSLKLTNWRNYREQEAVFAEDINIIYGANAQGKTNLLEAISYLSLASSFRTATDVDLINKDEDFFHLAGEIISEQAGKITISAAMNRQKKRKWLINNQPKQRLVDIVGIFHTVVFSPEDIYLVKGGPELRRRWLNRQISQIDPLYCQDLLRYNHILKQRNTLLKQWFEHPDEEALAVWDKQLVDYGVKITSSRALIIEQLNIIAHQLHQGLTGQEQLQLGYLSRLHPEAGLSGDDLSTAYQQELEKNQQRERLRGTTLVGPHRDDIKISLDSAPARDFASQGQQRTLAVSLKLAELELAKAHKGEYPVLLLDDVLSELDEKRRKSVLAMPEMTQTFITMAGLEIKLSRGSHWLIEAGQIIN